MSLTLPKYELFEEGGQSRRSSKAIPGTIAEGYGRRRYEVDFIKFLTYAQASCDETVVHLNIIRDTHGENVNLVIIESLLNQYNLLGKKINKFIGYVESEWK